MFEYNERYCEWKDFGVADVDSSTIYHNYKTDCGNYILASKNNKYGKLIKAEESICPFCKRKIDVRMYD